MSNPAIKYHCVREFAAAIIREWTHGNVKWGNSEPVCYEKEE